jgi:DNA polymerase V
MNIFALVDCNNFYASCERSFNPKLEGKPIIVLSNNDGCVVARSNEAKKLGISMGEPYFKCVDICKKNQVFVFSSNYELYGDMSSRIMSILEEACPDMEVYSIDEAFLSFNSYCNYDLASYSADLRAKIKRSTGVPVSIGIASTKTLAKIANHYAKKHTTDGVFDLTDDKVQKSILSDFPVEDVWGVGRRIAARLKNFNIYNAFDLKNADIKLLRREFSVVMERMISELNGISCIPLEDVAPAKKQIMSSRSFGKPVVELEELEEAISSYASRACFKLRSQNSLASGIHIFVQTNYFRTDKKQYANTFNYYFTSPTADTCTVIATAKRCLRRIYRKGFEYKKVGIMLLDLIPNTIKQLDLITISDESEKMQVMKLMDNINERFGNKTLFVCAEGIDHRWKMQRNKISQRFSTRLEEALIVKCK